MDQNFQTSFIPKKPMVESRTTSSSSVGLFMIVAIFIFSTILLGSAGLYFYKQAQGSSLASMKNDLQLAKNRFEPTQITRLSVADKRLDAATEVLSKHLAISPIFEGLDSLTMKTVRYTKFTYALNGSKVEVKMSGQAIGYRSVALQADLFSKNKNFIDPVFSNLSLDDKGNVLFDLSFTIDSVYVDYQQMLEAASANSPVVSQSGVQN